MKDDQLNEEENADLDDPLTSEQGTVYEDEDQVQSALSDEDEDDEQDDDDSLNEVESENDVPSDRGQEKQ